MNVSCTLARLPNVLPNACPLLIGSLFRIYILRATPTAAGPYDVLQAEFWKTCKTSRKADQDTSATAVISSFKLTYRIKQLRYCRSPQGRQHRICFIRQVDCKDEITAAAFLYSPPGGCKNYVFTRGKCCHFFYFASSVNVFHAMFGIIFMKC